MLLYCSKKNHLSITGIYPISQLAKLVHYNPLWNFLELQSLDDNRIYAKVAITQIMIVQGERAP